MDQCCYYRLVCVCVHVSVVVSLVYRRVCVSLSVSGCRVVSAAVVVVALLKKKSYCTLYAIRHIRVTAAHLLCSSQEVADTIVQSNHCTFPFQRQFNSNQSSPSSHLIPSHHHPLYYTLLHSPALYTGWCTRTLHFILHYHYTLHTLVARDSNLPPQARDNTNTNITTNHTK